MSEQLFEHVKKNFGITFHDNELLIEAFTHSSYANDHRELTLKNLERLEFLGDAVLELTVSEYLYKKFPELPEGQLTRMRAAIVRAESLANLAKECELAQFLRLGKGEELMNGRKRPSLLCDVFEAFVGAIFLDQGMETVMDFLNRILFPKIDSGAFSHGMDHKTALQELLQKNGVVTIEYQVIKEIGPDHDRKFVVEVFVEGDSLGTGKGRSKKGAEQEAARVALQTLEKNS
ncbi:ribonuclease III [Marinilactibacillus psychrotolerans]|uniref:Ribonuclease 3 n=1 Tax=Marinilactibacillus psychrotolerans TaxID=191770 RepID=A0A511GYH5_9LACT|nr:ribonuclease III [Marinilactibacillus psychrotolerans]TLQ08688.1 ribonuclease III [Marinilactibacillus psychrotolerans]SDC22665.1 ribonuclease-3 [Marinilactibacillus psychrotolerans]GEL66307.1 ribonuclease 3 [Marinilactibacillus psychrotolerans]GEQ33171.1 ribonuclease III [Marinilactibacillus psychrotolerans]GEQ34949.1 ribonuclease III [Marinilactibacillus psychrotolerans]